jgi:FlaA1/EpsC-like NDP-sugar epimerase
LLIGLAARHRVGLQLGIDLLAWTVGLYAAILLRFELAPHAWSHWALTAAVIIAGTFQVAIGHLGGLYLGRWRFGSYDEVAALARSTIAVGGALVLVATVGFERHLLPISVAVAGTIFSLLVMTSSRFVWRFFIDRRLRPSRELATPIIVFGAGEAGAGLVQTMLRNPASAYYPVALLDDDPAKANLRVLGVPVLGGRDELGAVAARTGANQLVVAIPAAPASLLRALSNAALPGGISVSLLPPVDELLGAVPTLADVRPIDERDLLGRHEIHTDIEQIAGYLTNRRVLVTGAGGSIGSELCRQITRFGPSRLVMLDRDESALHAVQLSIEGRAMLTSRNLVVADLRDRDRLDEVFAEHRPHVVFHAAALKHLSLLELHPAEGVKTNVVGTNDLLEVAERHGVARFVNISTDKAANPTSVLGYTKRLAERLTAAAAERTGRPFLSVRFGNVLGSRGSVLEAFRKQLAGGGPLTVTHPQVTRYFMTVEEAVELVIQAGAIGRPGEALVLDMGSPVRIDDVARRLATQADRPVEIVYTGLRPGEKLHEELLGDGEADHRPFHPLITHVAVPPISMADIGGPTTAAALAPLCQIAGVLSVR